MKPRLNNRTIFFLALALGSFTLFLVTVRQQTQLLTQAKTPQNKPVAQKPPLILTKFLNRSLAGKLYRLNIDGQDPAGAPLSLSVTGLPRGLELSQCRSLSVPASSSIIPPAVKNGSNPKKPNTGAWYQIGYGSCTNMTVSNQMPAGASLIVRSGGLAQGMAFNYIVSNYSLTSRGWYWSISATQYADSDGNICVDAWDSDITDWGSFMVEIHGVDGDFHQYNPPTQLMTVMPPVTPTPTQTPTLTPTVDIRFPGCVWCGDQCINSAIKIACKANVTPPSGAICEKSDNRCLISYITPTPVPAIKTNPSIISCVVSGTPQTAGTYSVKAVLVNKNSGLSSTKSYFLTIDK